MLLGKQVLQELFGGEGRPQSPGGRSTPEERGMRTVWIPVTLQMMLM